jgi:sulfatase maturation enzyme AslB (radical SAM superfamily)
VKKISALTLVLTDRCNFSCPYCPQHKGNKSLRFEDIRTFLEFLRPRLAADAWLGFYGGEPLLRWPLVEKTVAYAEKMFAGRFRYTLTTNGSLLKREQVLFLRKFHFALVLSYDGLAQAKRDPGSIAAVEKALGELRELYPDGYTVNSVFTARTVPLLAASMKGLLKQGHERIQYGLDMSSPWRGAQLGVLKEQLSRLASSCLRYRERTGNMPLENFKDNGKRGVFACFAGRDRLALLPDRSVWGCYLFYDLLGHDPQNPDYAKYCYGRLEDFVSLPAKTRAAVTAKYAELRQDYFFSDRKELCGLCDDLEQCAVCPAAAALASGALAVLPAWVCQARKICRGAMSRFSGAASRFHGMASRLNRATPRGRKGC